MAAAATRVSDNHALVTPPRQVALLPQPLDHRQHRGPRQAALLGKLRRDLARGDRRVVGDIPPDLQLQFAKRRVGHASSLLIRLWA